jgi:hypothetical protein
MKKILMMLGLLTLGAAPLAASAHTDVRVGFNIGVPVVSYARPVYYDYDRVVVSRPYYPPNRVVYETYDDGYYSGGYRPVVVYRERGWDRGWRGHGRRRGHDHDD